MPAADGAGWVRRSAPHLPAEERAVIELDVLQPAALPVVTPAQVAAGTGVRRPDWLKVRVPGGKAYAEVKSLVDTHRLHTVCEEARCPNQAECWGAGTATLMILGDICTRSCGFCAVKTGRPTELDLDEPRRAAEAIRLMNLRHAVITSVNRDELADGGASVFAETIRQTRALSPMCRVEVLIPDFKGSEAALQLILDAGPEILNHNTETVPRLYKRVRPQARYDRTVELLARAKRWAVANNPAVLTKTGIMLGLGESLDEVVQVMKDLVAVGVDVFTAGQYLQPTKAHLPVERFVHPDEFAEIKRVGLALGFRYVESGPLVRSSDRAERQVA